MPVIVTTHGPLFTSANQTIPRKMLRDIERDVAEATQRLVQEKGQASFRYERKTYNVPGKWRASIHTDLSSDHAIVTDGGIVYGAWLEGVSSRNETTRFKGYFMWRRSLQAMRRGRAEKIAQPIVDRAVRELNA
jgi:hypothetical protein